MIYSYASAYFGFSNKLYYFILVIGIILFGVTMGVEYYILVLMLIGGFVFDRLARAFYLSKNYGDKH